MKIQTTVEIQATAEDIWRVMSDVERWPDWSPSVDSVKLLDGGQLEAGSRARIKQPKVPPIVWTVTELTPNQGFIWTSSALGIHSVGRHFIERTSTGSRVTLSIEQSGALIRFMPWLKSMSERYVEMEARGLKQHCEALVPAH